MFVLPLALLPVAVDKVSAALIVFHMTTCFGLPLLDTWFAE